MRERLRGNLTVPAVLVATSLIEVVALRSHTIGLVLIGLIGAIALLVIVFRANLKSVALGAAYACAFTLTWNGWFLGPVRPGDLLILVTVFLMLIANPGDAFRTPPWWVKQLPIAILLVALLTILFPTDPIYLANRVVLGATGQPTADTKGSLAGANLGVAFKFIIAVFALPMAFIGAARIDKRAARRLGIAFGMGAALSGWAATLDHFGTSFGRIITHVPNIGSRQLGFTNHPNFLAAGVVLGIPFAFWLLASGSRRERIIGLVSMLGLLGGDYASGSRGGAVCAVLVLAICVVLHPRTRAHTPTIALAGLVAAGAIIAVVPSLGQEILKVTRLSGSANTSGSDTVRAMVGAQGVRDFRHSPIHGIGLQASFDASQVYLQELASGGLILFAAMQVYMGGAIIGAWRLLKRNDMAMALLAALLAVLALNYFEADLTDRFYYVPAAILVAMMHTHHAEAVGEPDADHAREPGFARADGLPARRRRQPART